MSTIEGCLQGIYFLIKKDYIGDHGHRRVNASLIKEDPEIVLIYWITNNNRLFIIFYLISSINIYKLVFEENQDG